MVGIYNLPLPSAPAASTIHRIEFSLRISTTHLVLKILFLIQLLCASMWWSLLEANPNGKGEFSAMAADWRRERQLLIADTSPAKTMSSIFRLINRRTLLVTPREEPSLSFLFLKEVFYKLQDPPPLRPVNAGQRSLCGFVEESTIRNPLPRGSDGLHTELVNVLSPHINQWVVIYLLQTTECKAARNLRHRFSKKS